MATNFVVFSDVGLIRCLNGGRTYLNTLQLCLFVNNHTPLHNDAADGSWATEASFPGYARQTFAFVAPVNNAAPPDSDMVDAVHTFTATAAPGAAQTIYGWYVIDPVDGKWIFAALVNRTPQPVIVNAGDQYRQTPRFTGATLAAYP